jgi:dTDP-4-amino-4,6-dideoxygalactose transaminase
MNIRRLRNHGAVKPFVHTEIGMNSRLGKFRPRYCASNCGIKDDIAKRQKVAQEYTQRFAGSTVKTPSLPKNGTFSPYTIRVPKRDAVQALTDAQIGSSRLSAGPAPARSVQDLGYKPGSLPVCEHATTETL